MVIRYLKRVYQLFPVLAERRSLNAEYTVRWPARFGGNRPVLMANPNLLLCDELSLGLAPVAVDQIYASFERIRAEGAAIVLVEQDVTRASSATDRFYCLLEGRVTLQGRSQNINSEELTRAYFGT